MRELEAQALALTPVISAAIAKALAPLREQLAIKDEAIAALSKRLDELPALVAPDLEAIAKLVELPKTQCNESVDLEAVAALVKLPEPERIDLEAIARAAAALIPAPIALEVEHGRDAIDLEIMPAIDEAKQYPRGTYAAHRGGLWKSYERTHGMRGWECIVDGIDRVEIKHDEGDPRVIFMGVTKSSGAQVHENIHVPIQIYKGVYRDEDTYEEHDNVTWAGSQWTSTKDFNTDKPGTSDAWQLTVKAGRPGKDLRDNASTFDASKGVKL